MTPKTKPLPVDLPIEIQRKLLFQPESNPTNYLPFEGAADFRFEPEATTHSRVNAWWLAEASWLAYWHDKDAVARVFSDRTGLSCELIATNGAECYVASSPRFAIVAFRGTQPDDWNDLFDDACFKPMRWDIGHVHKGFARRLDTVRPELDRVLNSLAAGCRVWFTGHSLGASVATLAAYRCRRLLGGVYTFGSPRVGNGVFSGTFGGEIDRRSARYANDHDIVTHVPPGPFALPHGLYSHIDHLRWINKDGLVGTTQPTLAHFVVDVFGRTNAMMDVVDQHRRGHGLVLPDALSDHTPLYYVLHCWNDFALHFGH